MRLLLGVILGIVAGFSYAEPIAIARGNGISITLHTDKCKISYLTNLPNRVVWKDTKTYEGCFAFFEESNSIGAFLDDGSVIVVPLGMFKPVTSL